MADEFKLLFNPLKVGPVTIRNRIMVTSHHSGIVESPVGIGGGPGFMGERYAYYQGDKAKGGAGLIVCGQTGVHPTVDGEVPNIMVAYDKRAIPGFRLVTDMIHKYGATAFVQFFHSGLNSSTETNKLTLFAPSTQANPAFEPAKAMEIEDIDELVEYYGKSAENAKAGGFDGVEVHSTHGYLPLQFLSPLLNRRTDEYGGSLENRMRFLLRIIDRVKEAIGDKMALGVRLCGDELIPGGLTPDETKEIAVKLEDTGKVDYISVSIGNAAMGNFLWTTPPMYIPSGYGEYAAAAIREAVDHIPVFIVGRIVDPLHAEQILAAGHADMIGMTRAQIADPELGNKAREGRLDDIRNCVGCCQGCVGKADDRAINIYCVQNPAVANEKEWGIGTLKQADKRKKVLIAGGGPGGMEAAWVAAARGHQVTLYEKTDRLGGQINTAYKLPGRDEMEGCARWRIRQVAQNNVKVVLNQEVTPELIKREKPDAVVVATGSKPFLGQYTLATPPPPGWDQDNVVSCEDIIEGRANVGGRVIILDIEGRIKGLAITDLLASQGKNIEFVTPLPYPAASWDPGSRQFLMSRAAKNGVKFTSSASITKISGKSVTIMDFFSEKERTEEGIDTVVITTCGKSVDELYFALKGKVPELYRIGDCLVPRTVDRAINDGHKVGRLL